MQKPQLSRAKENCRIRRIYATLSKHDREREEVSVYAYQQSLIISYVMDVYLSHFFSRALLRDLLSLSLQCHFLYMYSPPMLF